MSNLSPFQLGVMGLFVVFIVAGIGVFAGFGGYFGGSSVGTVTIWGSLNGEAMQSVLEVAGKDKAFEEASYVEKDAATYDVELLNALASGAGPDLIILRHDQVYAFRDKVILIPYGTVSQSAFLNTFIDEANILLGSQGSLALPFVVDPLVMYWNKDMFANAGVAQPPQYWKQLIELAPKITAIDSATKNVSKSAVALGQWSNVDNAKAILSALFMQAGDRIVVRGQSGQPVPVFGSTPETAAENPAASALRFYTEFTNPSQSTYSWNRGLPRSRSAFTSGDLAVYFGFASEFADIASRNPNLRFDVARLPQIEGAQTQTTFGNLYVLAIPRTAANAQGALVIAQKLTAGENVAAAAGALNLASARRDLLRDSPDNAVATVFARSALVARGWLDPNPQTSSNIFRSMVESVISGANQPAGAVSIAARDFANLFPQASVTVPGQ